MGSRDRKTLVGKLAWTLTLSSLFVAVFSIAVAMLVADAMIVQQAERATREAGMVLAGELSEDPALSSHLDEELRELGLDVRADVTLSGTLVAGGGELAALDPGEDCVTEPGRGDLVCSTAVPEQPELRVYTATPFERAHAHRQPGLLAAAGVLGLVLLGSGAFGTFAARRFLAPLDRLRAAVVEVDAAAPSSMQLPAPTGLQELDALRAALLNLAERLEDELQRARRFAANASHELRTPLTKISVELELAAEEAEDPTSLARLRAQTDRLVLLTERLLLLGTPREGLQTNQGAAMSELIEDLPERRSPEDAARLRLETPQSDGLVRGDPVLLTTLLDNAVDNALKFSSGPVHVTLRDVDGKVVIDVDDEGPGVSAADATALFEPFARAPTARARPGHGLGLALCAHIAAAYGGRVSFVPGRPVGARFRIELDTAG